MSAAPEHPQGVLRAPRVPFDLRCVLLATAGLVAVQLADFGLGKAFGVESPFSHLVGWVGRQIGAIGFLGEAFRLSMRPLLGWHPPALGWAQSAIAAIVFLAIWSFFGGAILRAISLRLTRDEPLSLKECIAFGGRSLPTYLVAPVLVVALAGVFFALNAAAGFVLSLWFVGSTLLNLVLFPLVLLSSLLLVFTLLGGLVGLPLMWAGISVEQNGALEALSRALSYLFARPFQAFFGYLLILVLMSVVLLVGSHFDNVVKTSLRAGIVRQEMDDLVRKPPTVESYTDEKSFHVRERRRQREWEGVTRFDNIRNAKWTDWIGFVWMWLLLNAFLLGFKGYAAYVFLGGTASLYLLLREEVDGTRGDEIHIEGEDELPDDSELRAKWVEGDGESEPPAAADGEAAEPESDPESA